MTINSMDDFQNTAKQRLIDWYEKHTGIRLEEDEVFIVWSVKALKNFKCLVSTVVNGDGIYAEYTYNGEKCELYEDVYKKLSNVCYSEKTYDDSVCKIVSMGC